MMHSVQCFLFLFICYVTANCSFSITPANFCNLIDEAPVAELTSSDRNMVFEDPGTIIAYHGFGCAESAKSGKEDIIKVEQSLDIPRYAKATVFLNGWKSSYLSDGDHKVAGLATLIRNIKIDGGTLKWQAGGVLSDDNFDDAYNWCYYYTVVAWNPSNINLTVDDKDGSCDSNHPSEVKFFFAGNKGTTTALSSFPTILQNPDFASSKTVAILPRGFGFKWDYDVGNYDDNKLLQIGYNLDHSEIFNEKGKHYLKGFGTTTSGEDFSLVDSGYVSWETYAIFKDEDTRREYEFGEIVSGLGGDDLGVIQPPFSILPIAEYDAIFSTCVSGPGPLKTEEFEIDNIPYAYAVPMLTGWELGYDCDDNNVKEIGIWIDKWSYQKDPGASAGKLRYTLSSILRDKNGKPYFSSRHKVTVLGLKPVTPGTTPSRRVSDLVPFSPPGADPTAFCRIEQGGKLLRVTVKNQGNADAGPSKTTVAFGTIPETVDTPLIPAGGSVDLLNNA